MHKKGLWFDVEKKNYTTFVLFVLFTDCCGLM